MSSSQRRQRKNIEVDLIKKLKSKHYGYIESRAKDEWIDLYYNRFGVLKHYFPNRLVVRPLTEDELQIEIYTKDGNKFPDELRIFLGIIDGKTS